MGEWLLPQLHGRGSGRCACENLLEPRRKGRYRRARCQVSCHTCSRDWAPTIPAHTAPVSTFADRKSPACASALAFPASKNAVISSWLNEKVTQWARVLHWAETSRPACRPRPQATRCPRIAFRCTNSAGAAHGWEWRRDAWARYPCTYGVGIQRSCHQIAGLKRASRCSTWP